MATISIVTFYAPAYATSIDFVPLPLSDPMRMITEEVDKSQPDVGLLIYEQLTLAPGGSSCFTVRFADKLYRHLS